MTEKMKRLLAMLLSMALLMGGAPVLAEDAAEPSVEAAVELTVEPQSDATPEAPAAEEVSPEPTEAPAEEVTEAEPSAEPSAVATAEPLPDDADEVPAESDGVEENVPTEPIEAPVPEFAEEAADDGAAETPVSSFKYSIKKGKCSITRFTGRETEVVVPASIGGAPVTAIAKRAFDGCKALISVRIPEGVEGIGAQAFRSCIALEKVYAPASVVEMASDAFKGCKKPVLVVDQNSWIYNWCLQHDAAYALSGVVLNAPTSIALSHSEATLGVKESLTLTAVDDLGGSDGFSFQSSKSRVAAVSASGAITAKSAGTAVITVRTSNGVQANCTVTVQKAPSRITLSDRELTLFVGQKHALQYTLPAKTAGTVRFASDSACASVDADGTITALAIGTARITARTYNGKAASCTLRIVDEPDRVAFERTSLSVPLQMTAQLTPVIPDGTRTTYRYISSDEAVAAVDESGLVTGLRVGTAVITVTTRNGHTAACTVEVTPAPTQILLPESEITLGVKESLPLNAVDDLGSSEGFTYKSSKPRVAAVSASGVITAKATGTAVITVRSFSGVQADCKVTVQKAPSKISLSDRNITLFVGQKHDLRYTLPAKTAGSVSFSSDSDCASVDEDGVITALDEGTARITARTFNGKTASCTVTVKSSQYAITGMRTEGSRIYATVSTRSACTFRAEVLSEDGEELLFDASAPVAEALQLAEVFAETGRAFPQYYLLRGVLLDEKGQALCSACISKRYTSAYQDFEQQQPSDYEKSRVLDFGDAGFGVLADGVIVISGQAIRNGDEYSFYTDQVIHAGDVLLLNGTPVKVAQVVSGSRSGDDGAADGRTVVVTDKNLAIQEAYKTIRVDGYVDMGEAFQKGSAARLRKVGNDEAIAELLKFKKEFELSENVTLTAELGGTVRLRLIYDEVKFGKDYFETEFYVETGGEIDVFAGVGAKRERTFEVMDIRLPIGMTGLSFDLELNIPASFELKSGGNVTYKFTSKKGVAYTPDMGKQEINEEAQPDLVTKVDAEFTGSIGVAISGGLQFFNDALRLALNGEVGVQVKGEWAPLNSDSPMTEAKTYFHACQQCLEIVASIYGEFYVSLSARINAKGEERDILPRFTLARAEIPVLEFYYSLLNEALSVHGGKAKFGAGDCPNNKYRATVYSVDEYGEDITGIPISVSCAGMQDLTGATDWLYYLYPGAYQVVGDFDGCPVSGILTIDNRPGSVTLNAPAYSLNGYVTDHYTKAPISGATVTISVPGDRTFMAQTDDEGHYAFRNLKSGDCSMLFSARGYSDKGFDGLNFKPGTVNQLNVELMGALPLLKATARKQTVQAVPEDGSIPTEDIPKITISHKTDKYGDDCELTLTYEGCAEPYVMTGYYIYDCSAVCMDMGDGQYTIIFGGYQQGTMGGEISVILQVINGRLTVVKDFTSFQNTDGIYATGKFSSDTKFSGTIYPTKTKFTAETRASGWSEKRTGKPIYMKNRGYLDYQRNEEGYYDIIFTTVENCLMNADSVGNSYTLYRMEKGKLVIQKQWYKGLTY